MDGGGGGGGEEGVYNCNIAQAATQLPYVLLCSCQLSIRNVFCIHFYSQRFAHVMPANE